MTSLYNASLESYQKILKPCRELEKPLAPYREIQRQMEKSLAPYREIQRQMEKSLAPYREIQRQIKTLQAVANNLSIPHYIVSIPTKILESSRTNVEGRKDENDPKESSQEASNSKNELSEENQLSIDKLPFGFSNSHISQR